MKADFRRLNVDLPIDSDEELSSPPPNGAKFNWITLKLEIPEQSSENMTPLVPMTKFTLVRSPGLTREEWQSAIEARKVLLLESSQSAKLETDKLSEDVDLAGEGE